MDTSVTLLRERQILLGVTGSIACYKAVDLASKLTQAGARVNVVLTESAQRFVSALSFQAVTGQQAYGDLWEMGDHVRHVKLGEQADLMVVVPATAQTIAKLAHGMADNLLTVAALAARCPLLVAPAMDGGMFEHPATRSNLNLLIERGVSVVGPVQGRMASGLVGIGRMAEPDQILGHIRLVLAKEGPLQNRHVVVTAGPTQEPLDPVRFLSNRSSGKQGIALAQAALDFGAAVTLIAGPNVGPLPLGAEHVPVRTALEMRDAVLSAVLNADALLMASAVSDFRPEHFSTQKLKKSDIAGADWTLSLSRNPDILLAVREQKRKVRKPLITLGFAAETQDLIGYGQEKLEAKGLDFIAVNDVSASDSGFVVDTNRVTLLSADGRVVEMPLQSKSMIAENIVEEVSAALGQPNR